MNSTPTRRLAEAVRLALAGDWQAAHGIVQQYEDVTTDAELRDIEAALRRHGG